MLKKTMTYVDYDRNKRTEDFYFNLNKAELAQMSMSQAGGFEKFFNKITQQQDVAKIANLFKELILKSYGEKSDDGKRFIKSAELSEAFSQTEAFSDLYVEMIQDPQKAIEFCTGIIPADMANSQEVKDAVARTKIEMAAIETTATVAN